MKFLLIFYLLTLSLSTFATEISNSHSGRYVCQCTHESCKESLNKIVELVIDGVNDRIEIIYDQETQSGSPARTMYRDGSVLYTLASKGTVGFDAKGKIKFGWGKLWSCSRVQS